MAKKYVFVRLPVNVYKFYEEERNKEVVELKKMYNKDVKIPMTKFFNAVILKHKDIKPLIPFSKSGLYKSLNRRFYE